MSVKGGFVTAAPPRCGVDPGLWNGKDTVMKQRLLWVWISVLFGATAHAGWSGTYSLEREGDVPGSVVKTLTWSVADPATETPEAQWFALRAVKVDGQELRVWLLSRGYPPEALAEARKTTRRYITQEGSSAALEFLDRFTREAVLPSVGGWNDLFPRAPDAARPGAAAPGKVDYLGHSYVLENSVPSGAAALPPRETTTVSLRSNALIGIPSNRRQKDPTRRYDRTDYEMVRLTKNEYREWAAAGINCFRVDREQAAWIEDWGVYHWGIGGSDVGYPECLYRSNYLGPSLYFDEPGVVTRDGVVRPKLAKDPDLRAALTPERVLEDFRGHFHHELVEGPPARFLRGLMARPDVDLGNMKFLQRNLYTWETLISTASVQLATGEDNPPAAVVFEPPGRVGTRRILPEINMTYGCQISTDSPKNFIEMIYGFARGAARATGKDWGMSIYGAVDRADAFWFQTHAYDLGARYFFYWDNYQLAAVPYPEYLALSRNLAAHVESHPHRNLESLKAAAEVAILLPPGYNLGHVHLGKGSFWGLGELNLERRNRRGVKYRTVMANFFTEIERVIRLGVAYDLLWDLPEHALDGYREVVRIREDGTVEVRDAQGTHSFAAPRTPERPSGDAPGLTVEVKGEGAAPLSMTARARVTEGSARIYYTLGADAQGVYPNLRVAWELYGPADEDYRFLREESWNARVREDDAGAPHSGATVEVDFKIERPGSYRLRAATVDVAGRTTVVWKQIEVAE